MPRRDFCAFILTHGRPDKVVTYVSLRKMGYTGKVFFVVDDEDQTRDRYIENFGADNVITFSKEEIAQTFDECDNFSDRRSIVYARNACFQIAEDLGYRFFIQLDDDYHDFRYRFDDALEYVFDRIHSLDKVFTALLTYFKETPQLACLAIGQGGDFIGGDQSWIVNRVRTRRKAMNSLICSTDRPFKFTGRINEDVNAYTHLGSQGKLFLTVLNVSLSQLQTQSNAGGMTDIYKASGTYVKSFYTIMHCPSSVFIKEMAGEHGRIHHEVKWRYAVPCILNEEHKKRAQD